MAVCVLNEGGLELPLAQGEIEDAVACALSHEGVEREVEVSVNIVDEVQMAALNGQWRGVAAPTDVLSFECDDPFDDSLPPDMPVELGDIVVAPQVIAAQAPEFGNTEAEEFRLMLVHSALHLLGYDHMAEDEALEMEAAELSILRELARRRGDDPDAVRIGPMTRHAEEDA